MSAIIKTLKSTVNDVEQSVYPKTVLEAVVDAETNETLDVILDNLNEKIDNIEPGGGGTTYELSRTDDTIILTGKDGSSSEVSVSDKVSKSGDTMTGTLKISNGSFPALVLKHTGEDGGTTAGMQFENSNGVLGGIGMPNKGNELRRWNKDLTTSYEILDSGNYSNYAVPKTGGTFRGGVTFDSGVNVKGGFTSSKSTIFPQDYYVFHTKDGAGSTGYWKLCTITITGEYAGSVIEFDMTCRYGFGKLYVSFNGTTDISAYAVNTFKQTGGLRQCYIVKTSGTSSGSVFDIYIQKEEAWGDLTITHMKFPVHMRSKCSLVWSGAYASSVPSGCTVANLGNDGMVSGDLKKGSNSVSIKYVRSTIILCVDVTDTVGTYLITPRVNSAGLFDIKELAITGTSISVSASYTTLTIVSQNSGSYTYIEIL